MARFQLHDLVSFFNRYSRVVSLGGLPSPEEFSRILARERERADRTEQGFSLAVFETGRPGEENGSARVLIDRILSRRVRAIDEVGWFKDDVIAAALPGTPPEGAWKFVRDVLNGFPRDTRPPECKVYTYPSSSGSHGNGRGGGRREAEASRQDASPRSDPTGQHAPTQKSGRTAERLEGFLSRPIPRWKRGLDIAGAVLGLVLLSPVFLLIALFIKIVSPGPVFFRQERIGYLGNPFLFWKFRTMHVHNDASGHRQYLSALIQGDAPMLKLDDEKDNRIIPLGKILRYSCLDELPQLLNVLKGDMSLVGPRPCLSYEAEKYLQWHARRFDTIPGMTGLWQVSGKNRTTFKEMIRLDIRYSQKMSPWLDTKILFLTGPAILGFVSEPLARKMGIGQESAVFTPSRKR